MSTLLRMQRWQCSRQGGFGLLALAATPGPGQLTGCRIDELALFHQLGFDATGLCCLAPRRCNTGTFSGSLAPESKHTPNLSHARPWESSAACTPLTWRGENNVSMSRAQERREGWERGLRYCLLVRNAAFVSCAGEASLDAALAALQRIFRLDKAAETEEVLAALRAHGAQLLSLLKALFKDLQFASWQRAGCAVEALRMACASALYASADAGGSQRKRWQELYDQSNRLFNRLQAACPDGAELLEIGPSEERHPKRRDSEDTDEEDEDEDEELEEDGEHRNQTTAQHVGLTQLLLDGLLRQALALHPLSQHEPVSDMDTLQRTFSHAETQLELLSEIFAAAPVAGAQKKERPWEKARSRKRSSLEVAEQAEIRNPGWRFMSPHIERYCTVWILGFGV